MAAHKLTIGGNALTPLNNSGVFLICRGCTHKQGNFNLVISSSHHM